MGTEIVKIDKSDIKEMVSSCMSYLLKEDKKENICTYVMIPYTQIKRNNDGIIFFTDSKDYARKHCPQGNCELYYVRMKFKEDECIVLGEGDLESLAKKRMLEAENPEVFFKYYPDNKTTCIVCNTLNSAVKRIVFPFTLGKREYNNDSSFEIEWKKDDYEVAQDKNRTKMLYKEGDILLRNPERGDYREIGYVVARYAGAKVILNQIHFWSVEPVDDVSCLKNTEPFKSNQPIYSVYMQLDSQFRGFGIGSKIFKKVIEDLGPNEHYLCWDNFKLAGRSDWDMIDKTMKNFGFKLIYYNDSVYFYYK